MLLVAALLALQGAAMPNPAQARAPSEVRVLSIDGVLNPLTARYLEEELTAAGDAAAVVVRLDTPGGVESSMRRMVTAILASRSPVVVYVAPPGARAASAGMFLVLAAHVAAMAPGTTIGAAHPVALGGQPDTTQMAKSVNDAAALARALAQRRGRNAAWAERAVRKSVSLTAVEAVDSAIVDLVTTDLDALLAALDGRRVQTIEGTVTMYTADARIVERHMSLPARIIHAITDPNIAYLLLTLGFLGILAEFLHPGTILPGATGTVALILAFVAFGSLPVNWAGIVLLVLGLGLIAADLVTAGIGLLAPGGVVVFVLGSLLLYSPVAPSPAMPGMRVSPILIAIMAVSMAAFLLVVGRALLRARRTRVATGASALVGRTGSAESPLAPNGTVRVDSEVWSAQAVPGEATIAAGETIEVVGLEGVILHVRRKRPKNSTHEEEA